MKFKSLVIVLSLLSLHLLIFPRAVAQTPSPSPSPSPVALKAGRLLDVRTGKVTSDVYVTIENHRIKSIGATPPQGVQIIDLSSSFVMPGMVDCHESGGFSSPARTEAATGANTVEIFRRYQAGDDDALDQDFGAEESSTI